MSDITLLKTYNNVSATSDVYSSAGANSRANAVSDTLLGYTENGTSIVTGGNTEDKDMFLKLLVAQMSNLDPFGENNDPTQYITQMAQFSTLEQLQSLNSAMNDLATLTNGLLVNSAVSTSSELLGKNAEFLTNEGKDTVKGTVQSVYIEDGLIYMDVKLENGETKPFPYESFVKVSI